MTDQSELWSEFRQRALQQGLTELDVRFRHDSAGLYPAKLVLSEKDHELKLSPQAVAAWQLVDVSKASRTDPSFERNFNEHNGAERLTLWQACKYLYGPLHNADWTVQSYNPRVAWLVNASDARMLVPEIATKKEWVSLEEITNSLQPEDEVHVGAGPADFPKLEEVASRLGRGGKLDELVRNNASVWASVHGSLTLLERYPHQFDPREDYWWLPERRLLVCYFDERFAARYLPSEAMRRVAHVVFSHFDQARRANRLGGKINASDQAAAWPALVEKYITVTSELPTIPEYDLVRKAWRHLKAASVREDLLGYIEASREQQGPVDFDTIGFVRRIPWFPYLGLQDASQLAPRQLFFAAYHGLFANTNSYERGGSMGFAPVLQNNPTETLLGYVRRWTRGETLDDTGFVTHGKDELADRRHYSVVVELYGFLNLHRQPFHNNKAVAYEHYARSNDGESVLPRLLRIGEDVRRFLTSNSLTLHFAAEFRRLIAAARLGRRIPFEGIRAGKKANENAGELEKQIDARFEKELRAAALERSEALSDLDAATSMFHLLLDACIYSSGVDVSQDDVSREPEPVAPPRPVRTLHLPASLEPVANDALAMLKAGFHVLFAGAPGTGKTTVAQFVGHAWNNSLESVERVIPTAAAPLTTVGNSAWAPFHTIGGLLPDKDGRFVSKAGIFVDPKSVNPGSSEWRLRDECIVLDEMNRADLDRCIGELYPLLSAGVERVAPAGIPGVETISGSDRFRIVATVNDARLDDVVFPISEGLARRFIRMELEGARLTEVQEFLSVPGSTALSARLEVAVRAVTELFQHCRDNALLSSSDVGEHLPFGVGYFGLLRSWCRGELSMSAEFSELDSPEQARRIIRMCLRAATKERRWEKVFHAFEAEESEA